MKQVLGYNIAIKNGGKIFAGVTQEDLSISANVKESLTKSDLGNKQVFVSGHNITFSVNGLVRVDLSAAEAVEALSRDEIIALSLLSGTDAELDIVYNVADGTSYMGKAIITSYSESSNSEDPSNFTLALQVSGELTACPAFNLNTLIATSATNITIGGVIASNTTPSAYGYQYKLSTATTYTTQVVANGITNGNKITFAIALAATANKTYDVRLYATVGSTTYYGSVKQVTTPA